MLIEILADMKKSRETIIKNPREHYPEALLADRLEIIIYKLSDLIDALGGSFEVSDKKSSVSMDRPLNSHGARSCVALAGLLMEICRLGIALGFGSERWVRPNSGREIYGPIPCLLEEAVDKLLKSRG